MIDTQAFRSKILDLAIHGRLTKQSDSETVHCDSIQDAATEPFPIPNNWKWLRIENVVSKDLGGGTPSKTVSEYWDNGTIPWMSVKDFSSAHNGFLEDTIDHITQNGLENSASNLIDTDAIIICMRMALGKIVKIKQPMAINQDLRAIWLMPFVDADYFFFFYSTLKVEGHGMTVAGINKKQLMSYMMPIPPLPEQRRIVERIKGAFSVLDTIDTLQTQYADNLTVLKGKLIDAAIQGKLTEQLPEDGTAEELYQLVQEERQRQEAAGTIKAVELAPAISDSDNPFSIPASWKWTNLGNVSYIVRGGSPRPIKQYITTREDGINWIKIGDVEKGGKYIYTTHEKIIPEGESKSRRVYPGDFLLTNSMSFGRPYISKIEGCIHDGWLLIHGLNGFDPDYLYYLLSSTYLYGQFTVKASGSTVDNLNIDKVKAAIIPLPPLAEQKRIAQKIDELMPIFDR